MKLFLIAAIAALFVATPVAADMLDYQVVKSHRQATSTTAATLGAGVPTTDGIQAVYLLMTAPGMVSIMPTPFATGTSAPVFVPADTPLVVKARDGQAITVRLESGTGVLYVNELSK